MPCRHSCLYVFRTDPVYARALDRSVSLQWPSVLFFLIERSSSVHDSLWFFHFTVTTTIVLITG